MNKAMKDEIGLLRLADATFSDMVANTETIEVGKLQPTVNKVITWFLPPVSHALKGGVRTAFMLAQKFSEQWGTLNQFVIYSYSGRDLPTSELCESLSTNFPTLKYTVAVFKRGVDDITVIPASNACICTLWTTAYLQLKYNQTQRKFYLMQDYEPTFYPAGGIYGAIEQTYRFGFSCIANTQGVGNKFKQYSDDVTIFTPGVDTSLYFPDANKKAIGKPARVVFYGRPSNPRNCFVTGTQTLKALKRKLGDAVEIISVGEDWNEADYDLDGVLENRGLLKTMEEVAELYRSADLGLVYMMTPHPSYQPPEYMASGCVTVTNLNESNTWLLNHENSLLIEPVPEIAAQRMHDLIKDTKTWSDKRDQGVKSLNLLDWDKAFCVVMERLKR
ncbi:glycosyltransferase family 4 protein [Shewanella donghaensis]|uniref:glycosyltransferase family 4 protein n=1 Tax=Shewanella donghaensis TaxID=238836 RepID=UPI001182DE04|nr:glycosyltransferase family 4 protein [Shewanella donghaensis]